jgi:serine/threonine protein kinase
MLETIKNFFFIITLPITNIVRKRNQPWLYINENNKSAESISDLLNDEIIKMIESRFIGTWINDMIVIDFLGRGTFSYCFLCFEPRTNTFKACKIILPCYYKEACKERDNIKKINLNNTIKCIKLPGHPRALCFVNTLFGESIGVLLDKNNFIKTNKDNLFYAIKQLCTQIVHIHNHNYVHCDIKLDNIMSNVYNNYILELKNYIISLNIQSQLEIENDTEIKSNKNVKKEINKKRNLIRNHIKDEMFKFKKIMKHQNNVNKQHFIEVEDFDNLLIDDLEDNLWTKTFNLASFYKLHLIDYGSLEKPQHDAYDITYYSYRAPENILNLDIQPSCDIWSLGCIIFEIITGELLFHERYYDSVINSEQDLLHQIFSKLGQKVEDKEYIKNSKYGKQYINSVHSLDNYETQSKIIYYLRQNNRFQLSLEEILLWSNLLQSMLVFIPSNRIKSNTLLKHPVFSCIENEYEDIFI